jgi:probable rRNA maturation factor
MKPSPDGRKRAGPSIDILVQSPLWRAQAKAEAAVREAVSATAATLATKNVELAVMLTDDNAVRALNREWRGIDAPTNVLTFPVKQPRTEEIPALLGDIVIAYETVARETAAQGKPFLHHLAHLAVHGFLHLMGYDHETERDAQAMERLERAVLARLDVPDPYLARDAGEK